MAKSLGADVAAGSKNGNWIQDALCEIDAIVKGGEALIEVSGTLDDELISARNLMGLASVKLMQLHETIDRGMRP